MFVMIAEFMYMYLFDVVLRCTEGYVSQTKAASISYVRKKNWAGPWGNMGQSKGISSL